MSLAINRLSGFIGAEVDADLDTLLRDDASDTVSTELQQALWDNHVLVFKALDPTPEQHLRLAGLLGTPSPPQPQNVSHPDFETITVFDSEVGYKADQWHADATFNDEVPQGAVLCMRECPPVGGDTMFTNAALAYEKLSGGMKKLLDDRRARHDITPDVGTEHPVVIDHPVTGRPVLFVNRIFTRSITNLPPEESAAILPFLLNHLTRPEFTYRHVWDSGDVVVWDNWSTQHYALFDFDERRVVHRVALDGRSLEPSPLAEAK